MTDSPKLSNPMTYSPKHRRHHSTASTTEPKINPKPTAPPRKHEAGEEAPLFVLITTYLGYALLTLVGHLREILDKFFFPEQFKDLRVHNGMAPLMSDFDSFYSRRSFFRIRDCWNRPVTGVPSRTITLLERTTPDENRTLQLTGEQVTCINMASYNYLGFAQAHGPCADAVEQCIDSVGVSIASPRAEHGTIAIHRELEELVARFLGVEAAVVFGMGFATNSAMIPALVDKGCLIMSDQLNHSSLVTGCRLSGATIATFLHNNMNDLEEKLREQIVSGQPRTHRPWRKILVVVEGLYSMEGSILRLPDLLALKRKYKFYLFVDEAHSIGALGPNGRGVCDLWGVDPREVDVLMGTFTKSFGAAGGYLAGSRQLVEHLKREGPGYLYSEPIMPPICQQVLTSMRIIMGEQEGCEDEGRLRLTAIRENSIYFMRELKKMGFIVYGDEGSPIIPALIFNPGKIAAFSRECLARGVAVVVVGFPATPIISSRVRFCISASHTRQDLDRVLSVVKEVGTIMMMRVSARRYVEEEDGALREIK